MRGALADYFALNRSTLAVALAMLLMSLGENLWKRFLPKYLEALGAPVAGIGLFGSAEDFLDGVYQYPGGWIGDHLGRRRALLLFVSIAAVGYLVYCLAPAWPWAFLGLIFAMAWTSMASPTLFSIIGDALPPRRRAMGFTVQAILRRLPILIAPTAGGFIIAGAGLLGGIRASLVLSVVLAAFTLIACASIPIDHAPSPERVRVKGVWDSLPRDLRRLLVSDVIIRTCEGLAGVFVVLYATNVVGIGSLQFGVLVAVQAFTSMVTYVPAARLADTVGRKPIVVATFGFFALFPIAVVLAQDFVSMIVAFAIGGLREVGEPARKAMIVDMVRPGVRARSIGLYYLLRSLAISPAAFIGGLLWNVAPAVPFVVAGLIGVAGTAVFVATVDARYAS
jgi:MFS family permease